MKREFLVERQGKWFVLYAGLLDEAHTQGLKAIRTQLIQAPSMENGHTAICLAEVTTAKGTFTGLGDASPENVSRMMAPHLIRMAETRAKARALRDSINVGVAALEELGEFDEPADSSDAHGRHQRTQPEAPKPAEATRATPTVQAVFEEPAKFRSQPVKPAAAPAPVAASAPARAAARQEPPDASTVASASQIQAIYRIGSGQHGLTDQQVDARSVETFGVAPSELTKEQAADFIRQLQPGRSQPSAPAPAPRSADATAESRG
jgi:hypothetical protein